MEFREAEVGLDDAGYVEGVVLQVLFVERGVEAVVFKPDDAVVDILFCIIRRSWDVDDKSPFSRDFVVFDACF